LEVKAADSWSFKTDVPGDSEAVGIFWWTWHILGIQFILLKSFSCLWCLMHPVRKHVTHFTSVLESIHFNFNAYGFWTLLKIQS
jgi:hypothetical protein